MKVLVTGSNGFIGRNLCASLEQRSDIELLCFNTTNNANDLIEFTQHADIIFHLAGVTRPKNVEEFITSNVGLTTRIVSMLERRRIPLVFASSIHAELDNPYGLSKKTAEDIVFAYRERTGAKVCVYRFPHVFGKWSRPNFSSVVATFCHNAANGLPLRVDDPLKELTLLYIDDIVKEFEAIINGKESISRFYETKPTYKITLEGLATCIQKFSLGRNGLTQYFDCLDELSSKLYATFTSYLPPAKLGIYADMKRDERGFFAELIRSPHFGQISVSRTKPGITRGNHWHNTKVEKFIVVEGEAVIRLSKYGAKEIVMCRVSGENIQVIDIPTGYVHSIENVGSTDVITLFWAGEIFDPQNPDTYFLEV